MTKKVKGLDQNRREHISDVSAQALHDLLTRAENLGAGGEALFPKIIKKKSKKKKSTKKIFIGIATSVIIITVMSVIVYSGAPVAFKTWCGHQYMVGIICPPG